MAKTASGKSLVIVESPTKAKTIRKFLGKHFVVESCMGHVRDLPRSAKDIPEKVKKEPWAKLGVNVDKNFAPLYCVPRDKNKIVTKLRKLIKEADELILATDEDREGESISWHLLEILKPKVPVRRMVFHEITKEAIQDSLSNTRNIDDNLVKAQETRRILDRLVGYSISPLLWKKVAYGLSAGRVQSVAVRLICEKEYERIRFKSSKYYGMTALLEKESKNFEARLQGIGGKKIATGKDFDPETGKLFADKKGKILEVSQDQIKKYQSQYKSGKWEVSGVEEKPVTRKPSPPFITSTLQQEASRKLGLSARNTMRVAQSLYEKGLITYMRTDSTNLSSQAITAARECIEDLYGPSYLPASPRIYGGKKVKGAQEAHEAIRPAGTHFITPDNSGLGKEELKLYDLIWKRTMASQMADAKQKQVRIAIEVGDGEFVANGMVIEFPGFLRAYVEGHDDPDEALGEREVHLPKLKKGDVPNCKDLNTTEHETKAPARYTEASLIQTLEKEGVGRPSTYAPTLSTVMDRGYVRKAGNALVPTFTAMVVNNLLSQHFPQYVDVGFTSGMEESLDNIADGDLDHLKYLKNLYLGGEGLKKQVESREKKIDPEKARSIEIEGLDGYEFRVGRYGAYVCRVENGEEVCASLPESQSPADVTVDIIEKLIYQKINGADALGKDPETNLPVYVLNGRYGPYVQLGDSEGEKEKPKRVSIPKGFDPENLDFDQALDLLSLPKLLGIHPETKEEIRAGIGRFGPFVVHQKDFRSIPKDESVFTINLNKALELLSQPKRGRGGASVLVDLGKHPNTGDELKILNGRYGPYVKLGKKNLSLPKDESVDDIKKWDQKKLIEFINKNEDSDSATKVKSSKAAPKSKVKKKAKKATKIAKTNKVKKKAKPATKAKKKTVGKKKAKKVSKGKAKKKKVSRSKK